MRYPFLCLASFCLAVTAFGQQRFQVSGSGSPEYRLAESAWLFTSARQLLYGERSALLASLKKRNKELGRAQAAGLMMLVADDPVSVQQFTEPLVRLIGEDALLFYIGHKAVELHPAAAWPVLQQMVVEGNQTAAYELTRYGELGQQQLKVIAHGKSALGRATALTYYSESKAQFEFLNDSDPRVIRVAVRNLLTSPEPHTVDRLLQDTRPKVRIAAATLADRWTDRNWPLWVKLASDPLPGVRQVAMLQMVPLGLKWGQGPWVLDGMVAVERGLQDKSPAVRRTAVMAVRGWMLEWDKTPTYWNAVQLAKAKSIIASDAFYIAISKLAKLREASFGSVDVEGIQMARAAQALAISKELRSAGRKVTR